MSVMFIGVGNSLIALMCSGRGCTLSLVILTPAQSTVSSPKVNLSLFSTMPFLPTSVR